MKISREAKQATTARRIDGQWEFEALAELIGQLQAWGGTQEKRASLYLRVGIWSFGLSLAVLSLGPQVAEIAAVEAGWAILWAGLAGVGLTVVLGVLLYRSDRGGIPEEILATLEQTLRLIRPDLHPKGTIQARVDLSADRKAWLELRFRLRDRYMVTLRQVDQLTETKRTIESANGKPKQKLRYRRVCRVRATVTPPSPTRWSLQAKLNSKWERVRIRPRPKGDRLVLDRWFVYKYKPEHGQRTPSGRELVGVLFRACSFRPAQGR